MRRPARPNTKQSETALQIQVVKFLRWAWPGDLPFWHTPNGGMRSAREAGKFQAMGVLAGVPDLVFIMPNGQAAFIELKVKDGRLSEDQASLRQTLTGLSCGYATCRSVEQVETVTARWLALFGRALRAKLT